MDYETELKEKYNEQADPVETDTWFSMLWSGEFSHADVCHLLAERDRLKKKLENITALRETDQEQIESLRDTQNNLLHTITLLWHILYPGQDWEYPAQVYQHIRVEIERLNGLLERDEAEIGPLVAVLNSILAWTEAYPTDVFPEPDMAKARALLEAGGMTLDSVSAYAMRHVVTNIAEMIKKGFEQVEAQKKQRDTVDDARLYYRGMVVNWHLPWQVEYDHGKAIIRNAQGWLMAEFTLGSGPQAELAVKAVNQLQDVPAGSQRALLEQVLAYLKCQPYSPKLKELYDQITAALGKDQPA